MKIALASLNGFPVSTLPGTLPVRWGDSERSMRTPYCWIAVVWSLAALPFWNSTFAQTVPGPVCKPVSQRTGEGGCWILAHQPIDQLTQSQTFWHIDVYPTRAAAEAAKGPRGTLIEAFGKVWLLTIEQASWRPTGGERVAEIGPLPITAGEKYSAQYMEATF